jgi:hypothetical protein
MDRQSVRARKRILNGSVEDIADPAWVGGQETTICGIDDGRFAGPRGPGYVFS